MLIKATKISQEKGDITFGMNTLKVMELGRLNTLSQDNTSKLIEGPTTPSETEALKKMGV